MEVVGNYMWRVYDREIVARYDVNQLTRSSDSEEAALNSNWWKRHLSQRAHAVGVIHRLRSAPLRTAALRILPLT